MVREKLPDKGIGNLAGLKKFESYSSCVDIPYMAARRVRFYRPELDAIRFLLFLLVLFGHYKEYVPVSTTAHPLLYAWQIAISFALPVFFLLSAFLIVELLLREREKTGTIAIKEFYIRRVLRIWPLYFGFFYFMAVVAHFIPRMGPPNHASWLAFTLFAGNVYIAKHGWVTYTIAPLWSISVEEQFYLTIPWLARWRGSQAIVWTSVLLTAVSYGTIWYYFNHLTAADDMIWVNSWVQFQFFAAGALLAILLRGRKLNLAIPLRLACYAGAAGCWFVAEYYLHWTASYWHPLSLSKALGGWALGMAGVLLVFVATLGFPEKYVPEWLVKMGNISFGLYVFHSLALYVCFFSLGRFAHRHLGAAATPVQTVVALGVLWAMAYSSHRWLEMPFLRMKKHFTVVASKEDGAGGKLSEPAPVHDRDAANRHPVSSGLGRGEEAVA
jgi:peptidoglycan/LPS O-acetylase OafA/YrhL